MDVLAAGRDSEFRDLAASLARILLIAPAVFAASTLSASVLNSFNRFAVAALAPVMYNLAIIGGALLLAEPFGIFGLAIGATAGACLHLLIQAPALVSLGVRWQPVFDIRHAGVQEVGRLFAPRVLGLGASQLNRVFSSVVLASFFTAGSIAVLDYAWLMTMLPLALAMAVGTAVFPTLSEESAMGNEGQLRDLFLLSLRMSLFLTIPASVGLMALGEPVIRLFFERGQFGPESTQATAYALVFYAIGLAGHATVEIVDRVFYALHDTRTPVLVAISAIVLNVLLALILMQTPLAFGGLALANGLAALAEGAVLARLVTQRIDGLSIGHIATPALRYLAASLVMGLPVVWLARWLGPLLEPIGAPGGAVLVGGCALVGALVYALSSLLFGSDEVRAFRRLARLG
jgi:putative peptidoglycan lipid II flippase